MDWMEQEQERGITITSAATTCCVERPPRSTSSTPPATSTSPSRSSARCACSTAPSRCSTASPASSPSPRPCGARPTSTTCPRICFVNKMDRIGADFFRCVDMIVDRLGRHPARPAAADRRRGRLHRRRRPGRDEGAGLARRDQDGRGLRGRGDPGRPASSRPPSTARSCSRPSPRPTTRSWRSTSRARSSPSTSSTRRSVAPPSPTSSPRSCAARRSRTRASSPCSTRSSTTCRARSTSPRSRVTSPATRTSSVERQPSDDEPFAALAFKIMTDPHLGKLTYIRVYSGSSRPAPRCSTRPRSSKERIGKIYQMHANKREEIDSRRRRRHRGRHRPQGHHHRRHPVRPGQPGRARVDDLPGAGHPGRHRAQDQGRPGEAGHRHPAAGRGGPDLPRSAPTRRPARPSSPAWASCTSRCWSTACSASSRSRPTSASRRSPTARPSRKPVEKVDYTHKKQTGGSGQFAKVQIDHRAAPAATARRLRVRRTRSPAAASRASTSPRWTPASRRPWSTACSPATRWSTSR